MRSYDSRQRIIWGIAAGLLCWGVYLAVGATGMFVQESMMDVRKSVIVAVCMLLFLALWSTTLRSRPGAEAEEVFQAGWSKAGLISVGMSAGGAAVWIVSSISWQSVARSTTTVMGWLAALCMIGAATAGMIALSDRFIKRGKWLGALGLVASLASLVIFVVRMSSQ